MYTDTLRHLCPSQTIKETLEAVIPERQAIAKELRELLQAPLSLSGNSTDPVLSSCRLPARLKGPRRGYR